MNLPRWHWLDEGLLPLFLIALRICWLWPWLEVLRRWLAPSYPGDLVPLWVLVALLAGGALAARIAGKRMNTLPGARGLVAACGIIAVIGLLWWQYARPVYAIWDPRWLQNAVQLLTSWGAEVSPVFLTALIAAGAWLRGILDGRRTPMYDDVWAAFVTGAVAFAALLLVVPLDPRGLPPGSAAWLLGYFAVGMSALAFASLELARVTGRSDPEARLPLNRYWVASVFSVIALLLLTGLAASALIAPDTVARLFGWTGIFWNLLAMLLGYVLLAVAYVVFFVLGPLVEWLRALIAGAPPPPPMEAAGFQKQLQQLAQEHSVALPPNWVEPIRWLGVAGGVVVLVLIFALALRSFRPGGDEEVEETRTLIFSSQMLRDQLAALLQHLRHRFQVTAPEATDPFLELGQEEANRREIRAVYQAWLAAAQESGHPRAPVQTPDEYAGSLSGLMTPQQDDLVVLTAHYVRARYGAQPPTPGEVDEVRRAWAALQAALAAIAAVK